MSEDRVLRESAKTVKQIVQDEYPFHLSKLEASVLEKVRKQSNFQSWRKVVLPAGLAVCAAAFFALVNPWSLGSFGEMSGAHQSQSDFEFASPDAGFSQALKKGYPILPAVTKEQNGYFVEVKDVMVDQQRIIYTMLVSGEKIDAIARETDEEKKAAAIYLGLSTQLGSLDKTGRVSPRLQLVNGTHHLVFKAAFMLKEEEMAEILGQPNPVLPIQLVKLAHTGNEVLAEIPLALPKELTSASKNVQPAPMTKPLLGSQDVVNSLAVTRLELSPTMMRAELQAKTKQGYKLKSLSNPRLVDGQGKEYLPINPAADLEKDSERENYLYMDSIPSLYFEDLPDTLALKFDGMTVSTLKTAHFTLERNGAYPLEVPFGNKTSQILRVYYDQNKLHVVLPPISLTEETQFKIDGVLYDRESFENGAFTFSFPLPEKEEYQVETQRVDSQEIKVDGVVPIKEGN